MKNIRKLLDIVNELEKWLVIFVFIVMIAATFAQVLNRNVFKLPIGWFEELARYGQVYLALLAMEFGLRDGSQISLTAVTDRLHGKLKTAVGLLAKGIVVAFTILLFIKSVELFTAQMTSGQKSPGLKVAMYVPYFALPLSFGIAAVVQSGAFIGQIYEQLFKSKRR